MIFCIFTIATLYSTGALLMALWLVERHGQSHCEENKALTVFQIAIWPLLIVGLWLASFLVD